MAGTAYAFIGDSGQEIFKFELPWEGKAIPSQETVKMDGPFMTDKKRLYLKETRGEAAGDVKNVSLADGILTVEVVPFTTRSDYEIHIGDTVVKRSDIGALKTRTMDDFAAGVYEDVVYRLYTPKSEGKHPMILFLHGGGNGGPCDELGDDRDNEKQLRADYGCVNFAENYPDCFVLAPQAKEPRRNGGIPAMNLRTQTFGGDRQDPDRGWSRSYLAKVCEIIRKMIADGRVDEKRIYVTGNSMGGAGTIRAMSVGSDLFAACAPVCPTMTKETYSILRSMKAPVWVSTAYVDHTIYRHKYIVDAIMELKDNGHKNAHLTLYSPEELAAYDVAVTPGLTHEQRFSENHASWILTWHDEKGIMSWLFNQYKD